MPFKCGQLKQLVTLLKLNKYSDEQQNLSFLSLTRMISTTREDYYLLHFPRFVIGKNTYRHGMPMLNK